MSREVLNCIPSVIIVAIPWYKDWREKIPRLKCDTVFICKGGKIIDCPGRDLEPIKVGVSCGERWPNGSRVKKVYQNKSSSQKGGKQQEGMEAAEETGELKVHMWEFGGQ